MKEKNGPLLTTFLCLVSVLLCFLFFPKISHLLDSVTPAVTGRSVSIINWEGEVPDVEQKEPGASQSDHL